MAVAPICTRRLQWCHGHRLVGHEGKCVRPHGHNYVGHFHCEGALDGVGRVVDFSVIKQRIGGWIEDHWDHGFVVFDQDTLMIDLLEDFAKRSPGGASKSFRLPANPTAENLALYLLNTVCPAVLVETGVRCVRVDLEETENCSATATLAMDAPFSGLPPLGMEFQARFRTALELLRSQQ